MNTVNGFTSRFAIIMPNGQLWSRPRDPMMSTWFGTPDPGPAIFTTRAAAEYTLQSIRTAAADIGVEWIGTVVESYCSPFVIGDPGAQFAADVQAWLQHHGGDR